MLVAVSCALVHTDLMQKKRKEREFNYEYNSMRVSETLTSHFDHFTNESLFMVICRIATLQKTDGWFLIILWCTFLLAPLFVVAAALVWFDLPCFALFTNLLITIRWNVCLHARARALTHMARMSWLCQHSISVTHFVPFTKRNTHLFFQRHSPLRSNLFHTFLFNAGANLLRVFVCACVLPSLVNKKYYFFSF